MNLLEHLETDFLVGRQEIRGLAADQSIQPDRLRQQRRERRGERRLVGRGQRAERHVQQAECREDRDRLTELTMVGRSAPSQRRIVHRRQIVEDERRGMDQLDGRCGGQAAGRSRAAQLGAEHCQHRPHAFRRRVDACTPSTAARGCRRAARGAAAPRRRSSDTARRRTAPRSLRGGVSPSRTRACTDTGGTVRARSDEGPRGLASRMTRSGSTRSSLRRPGPPPSLLKSTMPIRPLGLSDRDRFFRSATGCSISW